MGPIRQVDAGTDIGYYEAGPAAGPVVILLHGWPYGIHSFAEVAPLLAAKGYRVIRSASARLWHDHIPVRRHTARNGQQAVLAVDIGSLMDALKIQKALIAGYDWGARTASIVAALHGPSASRRWCLSAVT